MHLIPLNIHILLKNNVQQIQILILIIFFYLFHFLNVIILLYKYHVLIYKLLNLLMNQ